MYEVFNRFRKFFTGMRNAWMCRVAEASDGIKVWDLQKVTTDWCCLSITFVVLDAYPTMFGNGIL